MSHAFQNQLFLASAGTGKTYRLASHFVGLLAREVAPERILATTFTKKAAGEILGRVWQRLVEVAQDPDAAQALSEAIGETVTCDQVRAVLPGLARQIHRFRVSTLDAHTMQVVRLFEAELGLPAGWNIVDEVTDGELRDEALSEALRAGDEASWGALLKGLDPTGERRGVFDHVRSQIRELRDKVLESEEAAWTQIHVPQGPGEHALQAAIDGLKAFDDLPLTKTKKPRVNYLRAQKEAIERAEQSQWEELLSKGMIPKLLANETVFGGAEIPEALQAILRVLAQEGVHRLLAQVYQRNESSYRLIQRFEEAYAAFKREHGVLRFDDLMRFLDPLAARQSLWRAREFALGRCLDAPGCAHRPLAARRIPRHLLGAMAFAAGLGRRNRLDPRRPRGRWAARCFASGTSNSPSTAGVRASPSCCPCWRSATGSRGRPSRKTIARPR